MGQQSRGSVAGRAFDVLKVIREKPLTYTQAAEDAGINPKTAAAILKAGVECGMVEAVKFERVGKQPVAPTGYVISKAWGGAGE